MLWRVTVLRCSTSEYINKSNQEGEDSKRTKKDELAREGKCKVKSELATRCLAYKDMWSLNIFNLCFTNVMNPQNLASLNTLIFQISLTNLQQQAWDSRFFFPRATV